MSPEEIIDAYKVVVDDIQNQTATEAARIGNAQRSLGPLAEKVASPSGQTSGLANYTYDRTFRPTVNTLSASLTTSGYAAALENNLKSSLRAAKNRYEDAKNNYTVASSGGGTTTPTTSGDDNKQEQTDPSYMPGTATGDSVYDKIQREGVSASGLAGWLGFTYAEDIQAELTKYYNQGVISTEDYIRECHIADTEYPHRSATEGNK